MNNKPKKLQKGDTIALVSPSRWESEEIIDQIKTKIEELGFHVYIHPQNYLRDNQCAGTPEQAASAIHDVFQMQNINAIICLSGGNGALHLVDLIDYSILKKNPKIFIGYSDATSLLNAFNTKANMVTFHGPNGHKFTHKDLPSHVADSFLSVTAGDVYEYDVRDAETIKEGTAQGTLLGGNLSIFTNLIGTDDLPSFKGKILIIEDYRLTYRGVDRMLLHLKRSGILKECAGLVVGSLTADPADYPNNRGVPFGKTPRDMVKDITEDLNIPVLFDVKFGHDKDLYTLPLGSKIELDTRNGKKVLRMLEPAVS